MKKIFILVLTFFYQLTNVNAQTTLVAGDIAFTGYNSNNGGTLQNDFSFVILRPLGIAINTTITFTDNGYKLSGGTPGLNTAEGTLVWTATSGALTQFSTVYIQINQAGNGVASISSGSIAGGFSNFILSQAGDQVLAYQGTSASPTFISGIHMNSDPTATPAGWDNMTSATTLTQNRSDVPPGLTNGTTCVAPDPNIGTSEKDNGRYKCTGSTNATSLVALRNSINTAANWDIQDVTSYSLQPALCTFSIGAANTAPTFINTSPQALTVCRSASATSINSLLTASDADASQTLTWSVTTSPTHGTLGGFNATAGSGSTSIAPSGLTYTPALGYNGSDVFVVQVSDGTSTASMTINVTVNICSTTWNGTTWSNGNPAANVNAIIASNTTPGSFTCDDLNINSGVALTIGSGITATVNGNINNSGNGISGIGTLVIADNSTLSGTAITLSGTLNLSAGTFTTGGLLSIAPGGNIIGTYANISGAVTLQQVIIGQRGWRIFANPFASAQTVATLASTNNIAITTTVQASGLTDARTFSNSTNLWSNVTGATINANTAYSLFIRGLTSEVTGGTYTGGPSAFTYKATGTLNGNSVSITPTNTSNFILIGNPYAAPVKSSSLTNGVGVSYYVYTIAQGGTQALQRTKAGSWSPVLSSSATNTIPVLGAIAYQPASTSSYNITAASDINTTGTLQTGLFRTQDITIPHLELQLEQDGMYLDKLFVRQDNNGTSNGTDRNDLAKFWNDNVNLYTKTIDNKYLGIDARATIDSIPLGISALVGDYVFKVVNNSLPINYTTYLQDNFLNKTTELKENTAYPFSITADAGSKGEKRFVLNFSKMPPIVLPQGYEVKVLGNIVKGNTASISIAGSDAPISITVTDILGRKISTVNNLTNGTSSIQIGSSQSGIYFLQITNGKTVIVEKIVKQ